MISAPLPQAAALLFAIVANALVANTAPAAAFLHPSATALRPRGTRAPSPIHRANSEVADRDLPRSARRYGTTAAKTTTTTTSLRLFGNVFGRDGTVAAEEGGVVREGELARFAFPATAGSHPIPPAVDLEFDSLSIMIGEWSKLFVADEHGVKKVTGLTTPVTVVDLAANAEEKEDEKEEENEEEEEEDGDVVKFSGVQLLFKKGKTGGRSAYRDKDDERMHGKNEREEGRKDDDNADAANEGGVQVRVERLSGGDLRVIASRCAVEEGTMTKEMSEGVIIDSLRKAIAAWRKEQAS
jgi:hypothetical protein